MLHAAISPTGAPLSFFTLTYRSRLSVRFLPTTISRFIAPPSPTVVHASSRPRRQSILKRWPRIAIYTCFYPVRSLPAPREPFRRKKTTRLRSAQTNTPPPSLVSPPTRFFHHHNPPISAICCSHQRSPAIFVAHRASLPFACFQHHRHPMTTAASQATACWGPVALSSRS